MADDKIWIVTEVEISEAVEIRRGEPSRLEPIFDQHQVIPFINQPTPIFNQHLINQPTPIFNQHQVIPFINQPTPIFNQHQVIRFFDRVTKVVKQRVPLDAIALKSQMSGLLKVVGDLFEQAEQQPSDMVLDEMKLVVEINAEGQVSIMGNGGKLGDKGTIELKFKRMPPT